MSDEQNKTRKMSAASFFNENRAIAGFGNSMRAVFTSVRELVENGLDASEKLGVNPKIYVELRKLSSKEINELLDITRYKKLEKHLDFLQLTVRDNGVGVPGSQIPNLFGRVLTGTKYGVIQTRGRFGLGAKMCLLYSMSSVDLPARIKSRYFMDEITTEVHLMINLEKNEPVIMEQHEYLPGDPNYLEESGTEISITFTGAWHLAKSSVKEYFKQLAIITPYASFEIKIPGDEEGSTEDLTFQKVVDDMPVPPKTIKLHPFGCDITQFKSKIAETKADNLIDFLTNDFMGVRREVAEEFFQILEIDPNKKPSELSSKEIRRIVHEGFIKAYQEAKDIKRKRDRLFRFDPPRGDALSPLGAARLRKGLEKELHPVFVEAVSRPPKAYSGHPFIIEAAIGYGGGVSQYAQSKSGTLQDNKIIYRYANRIPLIFGAGNDIITKVVTSMNWSEYGLTRQSDPLAIAVSLVSTKIPFPETSKEYISSVPEIEEEIRLALQQLGRRLKTFLSRAKRRKREHVRLSRFVRSAPVVVDNLTRILKEDNLAIANFDKEKNKIAAALAHGRRTYIRTFLSPGVPLFSLPLWCPDKYKSKLIEHKIDTVGKFLSISNSKLKEILRVSEEFVSDIKQRTIFELDKANLSPELPIRLLVSRVVEKRFTSKNNQSLTFNEALYQRWIQNSYHYLATEFTQLKLVSELVERLFENKKYEILLQISEYKQKNKEEVKEQTENDKSKETFDTYYADPFSIQNLSELKEIHLYPSFTYLINNESHLKIKSKTVEEFLFLTIKPSEISYDSNVTAFMIDYIKGVFTKLIEKFPEFSEYNVTKMQPDWIDGYTKNAFHRRKIAKISDFLSKKTDELVEIKEFQRSLYNSYLDIIINNEPSISIANISFFNTKGMDKGNGSIRNELKKLNITTTAQFISIKDNLLNKSKYRKIVNLLLKETKLKIIYHLIERNEDKDISHLKIIEKKTGDKIVENKIFTSSAFLITPTEKLREMGLNKQEIAKIKRTIGNVIPNSFKSHKFHVKYGIYTLEDIFFHSPKDYGIEETVDIQKFIDDFSILRMPVIYGFPELRKYSLRLNDIGVNSIGRFLFKDTTELATVLDSKEEIIKSLKENSKHLVKKIEKTSGDFVDNINYIKKLYPRLTNYFKDEQVRLLQLFYVYLDEIVPPNNSFWKKISKLQSLFEADILSLASLLPNPSKIKKAQEALLKLKIKGYETVGDFFNINSDIIENELSKASEKNIITELYSIIKDRKVDEKKDNFTSTILLLAEYIEFRQIFSLPISRFQDLTLEELELLTSQGIYAIHQFFEHSEEELASILKWSKAKLSTFLSNLNIDEDGPKFYSNLGKGKYKSVISFDFENSERFSNDEIRSLIYSGYQSIDQLFYLTNAYTFGVPVIRWETIDKFKKLLRSPLTLATWERKVLKKRINEETKKEEEVEEIKVHSLSHSQLNALRKVGIRRIIDLFLVKPEKIASVLNISNNDALLYLEDMRISETGLDLSELDIFNPAIVSALENVNIFTIEDLYFSTREEKWSLEELPWSVVKQLKDLMNLGFNYFSDMLDPDIIKALKKANISTLLGFLLTSPQVLMEKTDIPDERFENIKRGLDLGEAFYFFTLPVYFIPELTFRQTEKLRKSNISSIIDVIVTPVNKLKEILGVDSSKIKGILKDINSQKIREEYENKAIYAYETKLFDRSEQRMISKDTIYSYEGFQSIQELYFSVEQIFLKKDENIWKKASTIKKILNMPLKLFQEISDYSLSIFNNHGIASLYELLFILDADLTDKPLFRAVSDYASKLVDMSAFHYFDFVTVKAYNSSYFLSKIDVTENLTLLDAITNEKIINDLTLTPREMVFEKCNLSLIRSILEFPITKTSFVSLIPDENRKDFSDLKIGSLFDIESEENTVLQVIRKEMFKENIFDKLIKELSIPISSLGLPYELSLPLTRASITTLIDFYATPIKRLSEISGQTQKGIKEIKDSLSYIEIMEYHNKNSHPIQESSLIAKEQITELTKEGIKDIESLYYAGSHLGISKIISGQTYRNVREILSGSISFIGFLSFDEIKKLELNNIKSIIDLSLLPKEKIAQILGNLIYNEFHILDLISLDEIKEKREIFAISLSTCPSITPEYKEKLKELGINSIQDFISRMDEIRKSHPYLVNINVFTEAKLFLSSIVFLDLPLRKKMRLLYSGIGDILTFLTEDDTTISLILKMPEEQISKIKSEITISKLKTKVEKNGLIIEEIELLSKRYLSILQSINRKYAQDYYSLFYQMRSGSAQLENAINYFLTLCNSSIYRINELSTELKRKLASIGILRVIDLLSISVDEIKDEFSNGLEAIDLIKKGKFSISKGRELTDEEKSTFTDLNVYGLDVNKLTIEDTYSFVPEYLLTFSEGEKLVKTPVIAKIEAIILKLSLNVYNIDNFTLKTIRELHSKSIYNIADILSLSTNDKKALSSSVRKEVNDFVSNFTIESCIKEVPQFVYKILNENTTTQAFSDINEIIQCATIIPHVFLNFSSQYIDLFRRIEENIQKPVTWLNFFENRENFVLLKELMENNLVNIMDIVGLIFKKSFDDYDIKIKDDQIITLQNEIVNKITGFAVPSWALEIANMKIFSKNEKQTIKRKNIKYFSELIVAVSKGFINEKESGYNFIKPNLQMLTLSFVGYFNKEDMKKLEESGIENLYDLIVAPSPFIASIISNKKIELITEIKQNINIKEILKTIEPLGIKLKLLAQILNTELPILSNVPSPSTKDKTAHAMKIKQENPKLTTVDKLTTNGVNTLLQLFHSDLSEMQLDKDTQKEISQTMTLLFTPITSIAKYFDIDIKIAYELVNKNIKTYYDLIQTPVSQWKDSFHTMLELIENDEKEYIQKLILSNTTSLDVGVLGLGRTLTQYIYNLGILTVEQLYYSPKELFNSLPASYYSDIMQVREKLGKTVAILPALKFESVFSCYNKGLDSLIESLTYINVLDDKSIDDLLINVTQIKNLTGEEFAVPLSPQEEEISSYGYSSYQELLADSKLIKNKELFELISPYLLANIRYLNVGENVKKSLKSAGITTISQFLFLPIKSLASLSRIKFSTLQSMRSNFKLDKIKEQIDKAQKFEDLPFLTDKDKLTLSLFGIYSLSDLKENRPLNWLIDTKKINKVKAKIDKVLSTPILYHPDISKDNLIHISKKYFGNNIYSLNDLLLSPSISEFPEINTFIEELDNVIAKRKKTDLSIEKFLGKKDYSYLFSTDISRSDNNLVIDLISLVYQYRKHLSNDGKELLKIFQSPISILDIKSDLHNKLMSNNVLTVADLLIKPIDYYKKIFSQASVEQMSNLIGGLTKENIRQRRESRLKIKDMKIFDENIRKIVSEKYELYDDLALDIKLGYQLSSISSKIRNKIEKTLSKPTLLTILPHLNLDQWLKINADYTSLYDFFIISNSTIAKNYNLTADEVYKLKLGISDKSFIIAPIIKENKLFSSMDIIKLKEYGIRTYIDLINTKKTLVEDEILKTKIKSLFSLKTSVIDDTVSPPLSFFMLIFAFYHLDHLELDAETKNKIEDMYKFIFSKTLSLADRLSVPEDTEDKYTRSLSLEYLLILKTQDSQSYKRVLSSLSDEIMQKYNSLMSFLLRSPLMLFGTNKENIMKIVSLEINDIATMVTMTDRQLSSLLDTNKMIRIIRNMTLNDLATYSSNLTPIPASIVNDIDLKKLKEQNILSLEEVIAESNKTSKTKGVQIAKQILSVINESAFILVLFEADGRKVYSFLNENKLNTIYDVLAYCNNISNNENISLCKSFSSKITSETINKYKELGLKQLASFVAEETTIEDLKKLEILSIPQLLSLIETHSLPFDTTTLKELIAVLHSPISLLIPQKGIVKQLKKANIEQIKDILLIKDISKLDFKLSEKQNNELLNAIYEFDAKTVKNALSKNTYAIKNIGLFDENERTQLESNGYSHVIHLTISTERAIKQTAFTTKQFEHFKAMFESPIYDLSTLIRDNPTSLFNLYSKHILNLWDLFAVNPDELSIISKIPVRQLMAYFSTLTPQSLKIGKNERVKLLKSTPFLSSELLKQLKEKGISTFQELLFPPKAVKSSSLYKNNKIRNLLNLLEQPIDKLDIDLSLKEKIISLGIKKIKEFVVYPTAVLETKLGKSYNDIRKIKQTIPVLAVSSTPTKQSKLSSKKATEPKKKQQKKPVTKVSSSKVSTKGTGTKTKAVSSRSKPPKSTKTANKVSSVKSKTSKKVSSSKKTTGSPVKTQSSSKPASKSSKTSSQPATKDVGQKVKTTVTKTKSKVSKVVSSKTKSSQTKAKPKSSHRPPSSTKSGSKSISSKKSTSKTKVKQTTLLDKSQSQVKKKPSSSVKRKKENKVN